MQEDPASVFSQPEFKASLAKYEQMIQDGIHVYFEAEELTLIAEYYANAGDMKSSEEAIDYAISLHPENLDVQIYKCHTLFSHKKIQEAQQLLYSLPDQNDYEVRLLYTELALIQGDAEKSKTPVRTMLRRESIHRNIVRHLPAVPGLPDEERSLSMDIESV